jgi:hypothetical protein
MLLHEQHSCREEGDKGLCGVERARRSDQSEFGAFNLFDHIE